MFKSHTFTTTVFKKKFNETKYQLAFFAILIAVALICDQILSFIGSISTLVSIGTSLIYVFTLIAVGSVGLITLKHNTHNPVTKKSLLETKKLFPQLLIDLIKPASMLIVGSVITFALVIIPGILFVVRTMFVIPHTVLEKKSLREAFKASYYQTSKLTKRHVGFFVLFAVNLFLFVTSSSIISDASFSLIFLLITLPTLVVVSHATATYYLDLHKNTLVQDPEELSN